MIIKDWFINNNFTEHERYALSLSDLEVVKETEKALNIKATSDYGTKFFWVPKSCIVSEEELEAKREAFQKGADAYTNLVETAKNAGIKVRNRSKVDTIVAEAKKSGLFSAIENLVTYNHNYRRWSLVK